MITLQDEGESITKKLCLLVTWKGYKPVVTVSITIPHGYTLSPLKLTRGDLNGRNLFEFTFNCWKAER